MKNRDYTGLERTPSSIAWLIRKRSVAQGQIDRLEKQMREAPALIQALKATVNALDIVIPMHAVVVDPSAIKGTRHKAKSVLPHGVITRGIFACLKKAGGAPMGTIEIALFIAKEVDVVFSKRNGLLRAVSKRLNALAEKGTVVRHHNPVTVDYGSWSLAPKFFED